MHPEETESTFATHPSTSNAHDPSIHKLCMRLWINVEYCVSPGGVILPSYRLYLRRFPCGHEAYCTLLCPRYSAFRADL